MTEQIRGVQVNQGGENTQVNHYHEPPRPDVWPKRIGAVPVLASAFQDRAAVRARIAGPAVVLSGGGGVGKSQLAASYAIQAIRDGVELVVWVPAARAESVIASYSGAANQVRAAGADGADAERDARAFLDWLSTTERSWLVVLDDLHPDHLGDWWPVSHTGTGRVLATTRRRDAPLSGGGRAVVDMDVYTPEESATYLTERLGTFDGTGAELAEALGHLPLALSHAGAYLINEEVSCATYLRLFRDRRSRLGDLMSSGTDTDQYGTQVAVTLLLAVDAAQAVTPMALPALRFAAVLDPAGHPESLWSSAAVSQYLGGDGRSAMRLLHRYSLLTHTRETVRMHALTGRAAREATPDLDPAVGAAVESLLAEWPEVDTDQPELARVLRANVDALETQVGDLLWRDNRDRVLHIAAESLGNVGLYAAALTTSRRLADASTSHLGADHERSLSARGSLAVACHAAGLSTEAVRRGEQAVADCARVLGDRHRDTLSARVNLGFLCRAVGRSAEGTALLEQAVADCAELLDPDDPIGVAARMNLAYLYWESGQVGKSIALEEQRVADQERLAGSRHPNTFAAWTNLASSYRQVGRLDEALELGEKAVRTALAVLREDHPETLNCRSGLAVTYFELRRFAEAIAIEEDVAARRRLVLGPAHPDTLQAEKNLGMSYHGVGETERAIEVLERVVATAGEVLGPDNVEALQARAVLGDAYLLARRPESALPVLERVLADCTSTKGAGHLDTVQAQVSLALCLHRLGRSGEAVLLATKVLTTARQVLGDEHPATEFARQVLALCQPSP
ncbi:tetratricopeptide repeat protein [Crossiella sp. SN42]|uniref:tetratricopeptide repeat protein n=1 Tax=Crossiella sp. SN42 TaxID=2944808 RepID=UPI00207C52DB|nr:tetratricopeptide repeat protein [Crossiella sp. SN42]MCO1574148.1 tetratricopeptide repeat protein [Crossiella sp. SN42]